MNISTERHQAPNRDHGILLWIRGMTVLVVCALLSQSVVRAAETDAVRVLFIGNSLTYYNNMPSMLEAIAEASEGGPPFSAAMHVEGGRELREALELADLREVVRTGGWDVVVLQGQSRLGNSSFVNGRSVIEDPEPFFAAVREWCALIREAGAEPMLLSTWLEADETSRREWDMVGWSYRTIGRELGVEVVDADLAWKAFLDDYPSLELYGEDDFHPSPLGSLLVAALLYDELVETEHLKEEKLPRRFEGHPVDEEEGTTNVAEWVEIGVFSPAETEAIAQVVISVDSESALWQRPPPPALPALSELSGVAATAADFVGKWRGEAKHYPNFLPWPGDMTLELALERNGLLSGEMAISFEGSQFSVEVRLEDLMVEGDQLRFEDPNGPESSVVRYQGVLASSGRMRGLASLVSADDSLRMTGEWELERIEE